MKDLSTPPAEAPRSASYYEQERLRSIIGEAAKRRTEGLRLYEPLPSQERFHRSPYQERLLRGSNRGGKTLPAAVEVARAVTGQDPYERYPKTGGLCVCVGKDGNHCADPMWRKLARAGSFRIIRDVDTGLWRAYRAYDPGDSERGSEARPAPPLIPPRYIKYISWKNKKLGWPEKITLHNGWEIMFRSSEGKPPQGIQADLVWFDEEIIDPEWYPELSARIVENRGRFIWSATPQAGTEHLYTLHKRAMEGDRLVEEVVVLLSANKHISEQAKLDFASKLSPEERRVRIDGEFAIIGHLVYPEYSPLVHNCNWFQIPDTWTRVLAVDPGRQICAVLFAAVPPDRDHVYFYDELYIRQCNAQILGERLREKCGSNRFHIFLIDGHASRVGEMGSGVTVEQRYVDELKRHRLKSTTNGYGFTWGCDEPKAGELAFRSWLQIRPDGTTKLRVLRGACPEFENEIGRYHYAKVRGLLTDQPLKAHDHLMDCFSSDTEVLTEDGWRGFADLNGAVRLATVALGTDRIEYQFPTHLTKRWYDGPMIAIGGHKLDVLVTPTHRMVVYPRGSDTPTIRLAKDLTVWDRVKLHATWEGIDYPDADDFAEFLGWFVAEGHTSRRKYEVGVSQLPGWKRDELEALLKRLPWVWHSDPRGLRTADEGLWRQLRPLGNKYTKKVPDWVKRSCPRIIKRFLHGAILGDGWVQNDVPTYATVSPQLAGDIQELWIKCGMSASVITRPAKAYCIQGRTGSNTREQHWVRPWTTKTASLRDAHNNPNFREQPYCDYVYCATVPNGTLIVRRNGRPLIVGNCARYIAAYDPQYVKPKKTKKRPSGAVIALRDKRDRARMREFGTDRRHIHLGPKAGQHEWHGSGS